MNSETLRARFPSVGYMREEGHRRVPHFAWEYLDSGTGSEIALNRNRRALDDVHFMPRFMQGFRPPKLETELLGRKWSAPLGVAPIGLSGMIWPGSECHLARAATRRDLPYCLSIMACETRKPSGRWQTGKAGSSFIPLVDDLSNNMIQVGADELKELETRVMR